MLLSSEIYTDIKSSFQETIIPSWSDGLMMSSDIFKVVAPQLPIASSAFSKIILWCTLIDT